MPEIEAAALARLSAGERAVLLLLGVGHTAKSVAVETGLSVHAVNERLREARRKTGASSSRELARVLLAQESHYKQIGVEPCCPGDDVVDVPSHPAIGRRGIITMAGIIIVALAAFAASGGLQAPPPIDDPMLGSLLAGDRNEPRQLYRDVRAEPRDAGWATPVEAALGRRYARLLSISEAEVRVLCAASLCEVTGLVTDLKPGVLTELQRLGLSGVRDLGLESAAFAVGPTAFVAYARRAGGGSPVVTATSPAEDAVVAAGRFTLSVTFDRPMAARSVSFTTPDGAAAFPACAPGMPQQSADGRTYALHCTAEAGRRYAVGFNTPPFANFRSREGVPAKPAVLRFRTAGR